jgi:predicted NAD/FAD-binding protein
MRIAIVGAGISGLTCAYLLHREHDLVVYEAADRPGGHANTVFAETPTGVHAVDTGFIVFNDRNYPGFESLLSELDVATQPSDMSFGVSDGKDFEYNGASPNGLFASRGHLASPSFHRMIADLLRFNREARELLESDADPSLGGWLSERGYSDAFIRRLIVPQISAVWSADPGGRWGFPARFLLEFFDNHGMLGLRDRPRWRTISGGSRKYVEALVRPWRSSLRLSTPVERVRRDADGVMIRTRTSVERFDAVVMATHSDQALALLDDPSPLERQLLGAIAYQSNQAVLHTDETLLPRRRRAWASWNYHLREELEGPPAVTYHMNRLQSIDAEVELCVTLNRTAEIDPARIIRVIDYAHPMFTEAAVAAQARWHEISGRLRTHYCGAYWGWGFHEDGVQSALRVVREIGAAHQELLAA